MRQSAVSSKDLPHRIAKGAAPFLRQDKGATAIEFALLAFPFFALIGAILQTAMVFLATQIFDSAVYDASRLIQTGQAQTQGYNHTQFRQAVCDSLYGLFNCDAVKLKVTTYSSAIPISPLQSNGTWAASWANPTDYLPGQGNAIVQIQAYYKWPVPLNIGGILSHAVGLSPDGTKLLGASYVFMNEPFT